MKTYLVGFLVALLAGLLLTRVARVAGNWLGIVDIAWGRKIHQGAVPRFGGPAVAIAFFLPVYGLLLWDNRLSDIWKAQGSILWALLLGGSGAVALGLIDDIWHLRARYKLGGQIAIAAAVFYLGVQITRVHLPFVGTLEMGAFALPVTVLWILAFMNAINLIDGADGLCAGLVFIASLTIFIVSQVFGSLLVGLLTCAMAGAALGFLRHNFSPASIFLGDGGSYFFGFVLACASVIGAEKAHTAVAVLVPMLALGLPMMDTTLAVVRRSLLGRPIFAPDRGHLHHRLLDRGLSVPRAVVVLYGTNVVLAVAGIVIAVGQDLAAGLALIAVLVVAVLAIRWGGLWPGRQKERTPRDVLFAEQLPQLHEALARSRNLGDLETALSVFAEAANLELLELDVPELVPQSQIIHRLDETPKNRPRVEHTAHFRAGCDPGHLRLAWHSDNGRVLSSERALLELTADLVGRALRRAG